MVNFALAFIPSATNAFAGPAIAHYHLRYSFDSRSDKPYCTATSFIGRPASFETLHPHLYRLVRVKSIKDENGTSINFTQSIKAFECREQLHVNAIRVTLSAFTKNS